MFSVASKGIGICIKPLKCAFIASPGGDYPVLFTLSEDREEPHP